MGGGRRIPHSKASARDSFRRMLGLHRRAHKNPHDYRPTLHPSARRRPRTRQSNRDRPDVPVFGAGRPHDRLARLHLGHLALSARRSSPSSHRGRAEGESPTATWGFIPMRRNGHGARPGVVRRCRTCRSPFNSPCRPQGIVREALAGGAQIPPGGPTAGHVAPSPLPFAERRRRPRPRSGRLVKVRHAFATPQASRPLGARTPFKFTERTDICCIILVALSTGGMTSTAARWPIACGFRSRCSTPYAPPSAAASGDHGCPGRIGRRAAGRSSRPWPSPRRWRLAAAARFTSREEGDARPAGADRTELSGALARAVKQAVSFR